MKRSLILLLLLVLAGGLAWGQGRTVRLGGGQLPARQALDRIGAQCGLTVAFNEGVVNVGKTVSIPSGEMTMEEALRSILDQIDADFSLSGDQIVIVRKPVSAEKPAIYKGSVVDETGAPLPGAAVIVEETGGAVLTDPDGIFEIEAAPGCHLTAKMFGYKDETIDCGARKSVSFTLLPDRFILDESVVIGYGTVKRKDITTAVTIVSTKDVETRPITSAGSILQGKAAGVQVIQPSGMPGSGLSIRVRGATSVQASNEPLYQCSLYSSSNFPHDTFF